jgi:cell wall-associated NlpC family hydrolase
MMRRQIFMWMGLVVLFFALDAGQDVLAAGRYHVKNGDSLAKISKKFGVTIKALKEANDLQSDALKTRQLLVIPESSTTKTKTTQAKRSAPTATATYVVTAGDTLYRISRKSGVSISDLKMMNDIRNGRLRIGQRLALAIAESPGAPPAEMTDRDERASQGALPEEELEEDEAGTAGAGEWEKTDRDHQESADFLGKWESPNERQLFARVAIGFLGAPYRLGGSSVRGLDCSAFVRKIYSFFDINLPRTAREQAHIGKRIDRDDLEVGDLVFFKTRRRDFGHVGIYIGNNEFVHASSGRARAVRVDTLDKPYYSKRFVKAVRLKALGDDT